MSFLFMVAAMQQLNQSRRRMEEMNEFDRLRSKSHDDEEENDAERCPHCGRRNGIPGVTHCQECFTPLK